MDPIDRGFFRKAADGGTVFFPWGLAHRGYRLPAPDAEARRRARRAVSLLTGSVLAVGTWGGHALHEALRSADPSPAGAARALAAPLAVLALLLVLYAVWVARFVEGLLPSDLRVSREERMREAAESGSPRAVVWSGAALVAMSLGLVALEPRLWWMGVLGAATGAGVALWGRAVGRLDRPGPDGPRAGPPGSTGAAGSG